jgi:hypothetical protein
LLRNLRRARCQPVLFRPPDRYADQDDKRHARQCHDLRPAQAFEPPRGTLRRQVGLPAAPVEPAQGKLDGRLTPRRPGRRRLWHECREIVVGRHLPAGLFASFQRAAGSGGALEG